MSSRNLEKLRKNLAKRRKRRAGHTGTSLVNLKPASARLVERVVRDDVDVLQNIEFALADFYRQDRQGFIDDATVMQALRQSLLGVEPDDSPVGLLVEALASVRRFRDRLPDDRWNDAIRVVMASVQIHSSLAPGDTGYLDFVEPYLR